MLSDMHNMIVPLYDPCVYANLAHVYVADSSPRERVSASEVKLLILFQFPCHFTFNLLPSRIKLIMEVGKQHRPNYIGTRDNLVLITHFVFSMKFLIYCIQEVYLLSILISHTKLCLKKKLSLTLQAI